jgi:hypothetical protein
MADGSTAPALWSDDPAKTDLLSFDAVAATIADALLDRALDPVALGLSGPWGSGKTTVLGLVESELGTRATESAKVLVIKTDPWRYDPNTGAKESLISEVLAALAQGIDESQSGTESAKDAAKKMLGQLAKRVDWAKAIKLAAKTSLALQIPSVDDVVGLVKPKSDDGKDEEGRGLETFREEFQDLVNSEALSHVVAVAVLVDDLDRCLPETVIETLEAIRLFLSVPKMSFVIAADEDRVADAIATRFSSQSPSDQEGEAPAKLYLHKIVQTTFPIPALSRFDTQAFILLLQLQQNLDGGAVQPLIEGCAELRRNGGNLDDLTIADGINVAEPLAIASRLTPILYEKLRGNPRRIKRFLNDVRVRQAVAVRRGIDLETAVVAKLMLLEKLLPDDFTRLLDWLAQGSLRDRLEQLEEAAGRSSAEAAPANDSEKSAETASDSADDTPGKDESAGASSGSDFSEGMLRWAKLPPALAGTDLSPYLFLAASFAGTPLLDEAIPERLRDIAANLQSSAKADQRAVTDADLEALSRAEADALILHLGRTIRDQPGKQTAGVSGILRLARTHPDSVDKTQQALLMLPSDELRIATPLLVAPDDPAEVYDVLEKWKNGATDGRVKKAIESAEQKRSGT